MQTRWMVGRRGLEYHQHGEGEEERKDSEDHNCCRGIIDLLVFFREAGKLELDSFPIQRIAYHLDVSRDNRRTRQEKYAAVP